jgi:glycosyltransferase involved in cell wall biosynthesis
VSAPRRVLFVSHLSSLSGAEQALLRLVGALDRDRFEPLVVLPADGPLQERLEAGGCATAILPIAWWIPATNWSGPQFFAQLAGLADRVDRLRMLASRWGAQIVHTNTVVTIEGALAAARLGLPHVWHLRGQFWKGVFPPPYFDHVQFFFAAVDQLSDHVVCVSRAVERQIPPDCRLAPRSVLLDGLDVADSSALPSETRGALLRRYGIDEQSRLVACVGGIQRRKGQLDLVEAAKTVIPEFPNVVFVLCGAADAEYATQVRARIEALGLGPHFRFPGFEKDVPGVLAHVELLVHPARSEGFGLAILEAMAAGKPIVATRSGGPEEIIEDGLSGILVPAADPAALSGAVRRVLGDSSLAFALGQRAAQRARQFTLAATARETGSVYDRLLSSDRGADLLRLRELRAEEILADFLNLAGSGATPPDSRLE